MNPMEGYAKVVDDAGVVIAAWPHCVVAIGGPTELKAPVLNDGRPTRFIMGTFECALVAGYCFEGDTAVINIKVEVN